MLSRRQVKALGNTRWIESIHWSNPHQLWLKEPKEHPAVDQLFQALPSSVASFSTPVAPRHTTARILLHHYVHKSKEDFSAKVDRRSPDGHGKGWPFFNGINKQSVAESRDAVAIAEVCRLPEIIDAQTELIVQGVW